MASRLLIAAIFGVVALALSGVFCVIWSIPFVQGELFLRAVLFTAMLAFVVSDVFWQAARTGLGALFAAGFGLTLAFGVFTLSAFILYAGTGGFNVSDLRLLLLIGGWLVFPAGAVAGLVSWAYLCPRRQNPQRL